MKSTVRIFALILCVTLMFGLCSCSMSKNAADGDLSGGAFGPPMIGSSGDGESFEPSLGDTLPDASDSDDTGSDGAEGEKPSTEAVKRPAGLITAAAWDDNQNYEDWKKLFEKNSESGENGKFSSYTDIRSWGFDSYGRIKVTAWVGNDESARAAGAKVVARNSGGTVVYEAVTDANGVAYLFTDGEAGTLQITSGDYTADATYTGALDEEITVKLDGCAEKKNIIDIMFVVDVTGSMGDELDFLKNELADVIDRVANGSTDTAINLALLFYRDDGDAQKFAYRDFTDATEPLGLAAIQAALDGQYASGGGDYPEAVDEALELAVSKQWNTAATTKLIFHVLDAPPHSKEANVERYKSAVEAAAAKGIRICPILCSGAEEVTEYLVRQAAIHTAGTFIFVTDDSGIGNAHHDPGLPNATVEALNSLLVRLIKGYHTGEFAPPVYWKTEQANNQG